MAKYDKYYNFSKHLKIKFRKIGRLDLMKRLKYFFQAIAILNKVLLFFITYTLINYDNE